VRAELKQWLMATFGPVYEPARDVFWSIFAWDQRSNLAWLGVFVAIALGVYAFAESRRGERSVRGALRYLFPKEIWSHPSSRVDLKFFLPDKLIYPLVFGWLALSANWVSGLILGVTGPASQSGVGGASTTTAIAVNAGFTLASLLAFDLGYFIAHVLSHRVTILWEFHKAHHSAEVMTPFTNYREHPVDPLLQAFCQGVLMGAVMAAFTLAWPQVELLTVLGINVFQIPFFLVGNLRHSHVWLSFGWKTSHVLSSPAQHQIHHGTAPEHIDVNYGLYLSVWDWLAGTLYVPRGKEAVKVGLVGQAQEYTTVWRMYALPFVKAWGLVRTGRALTLMPNKPALEGVTKGDSPRLLRLDPSQ
jgi:sterol desaturase/sphingolipid hydroxylase (fatty acid hydroxylase superfamily)